MPIVRFRRILMQQGELERHFQLLRESNKTSTVDGLMCLDQIAIAWSDRRVVDLRSFDELVTGLIVRNEH